MTSGAVVTNHGKPRARLVPIDTEESGAALAAAQAAKSALTVLYSIQPDDDVAAELAELAASRDADVIGEPL